MIHMLRGYAEDTIHIMSGYPELSYRYYIPIKHEVVARSFYHELR